MLLVSQGAHRRGLEEPGLVESCPTNIDASEGAQ